MPLRIVQIAPGFNKTDTASGAEGQWVNGDFVRFRYKEPQKIGGWRGIGTETISGPVRDQHTWSDITGRKYAALGTSKVLLIYYEDQFYDITPLELATTGYTFTSTTGSATITVNKTSHNLDIGEYFIFDNVTLPGGGVTGYTIADFENQPFEIITAVANSFTITMPSNESGTGMTAAGSADIQTYVEIGPIEQTYGYGWGTSTWSRLTWGSASTTSSVILDPGSWSLDNFGEQLIATIKDGKTFVWNPGNFNALANRAVIMSDAPTATRLTLVSDRDRHLIHFGTETTIGNPATQDPMFIRFSDQENYNVYQPTSVNTAGTFRLDTGNKIIGAISGKDYNLILTDQAAYVMQFVGTPFTFSIRQVGTNCGCIGQHSIVYANGAVYWMGFAGGFFRFDGTVKQIPSLVEDFVFATTGDNVGINYSSSELIYASHNSLFNEIVWFYPSENADQVDRSVLYNYVENTWATSTLARTTFSDASTYSLPYATEFNTTLTPQFPVVNGVTNSFGASTYFAHETGVNEVGLDSVPVAIPAYVESGDFQLHEGGDAEYLMRVNRFLPDFKNLEGNVLITIQLKDYPIQNPTSSPLGPFTVNSTISKVDTRARGRLASIKIQNTAVGDNWRFGEFRADVNADGRR
ncbi:MAG: hypothetical protein ABF277_02500 [Candidatus Arcticimaribacter sp.]|jgi:hypothetical protein